MQSHHLSIKKTARYFTWGQLSENTKNVWFACHGYGQLAEFFIKKFDALNPEENYVVCPEALSRFYLDGFGGRVGATWMTKEDRLCEIRDYISYLNMLYEKVFSESTKNSEQVKIKILGFSQGTATVCRWVFDGQIRFDELILWAGNLAHDLAFEHTEAILGGKKIYMVYGDQDEFIKSEHITAQEKLIQEKNLKVEVIPFEGKHELNREVIVDLSKK